MTASIDDLRPLWEAALVGAVRCGGDSQRLVVSPPADEGAIRAVEAVIGQDIPGGLRRFLGEESAGVEVAWEIPEGCAAPIAGICSGRLAFSLEQIRFLVPAHRDWTASVLAGADATYGQVWQRKFPFFVVGNGDAIAIDLDDPGGGVVYLSLEWGRGHGARLGADFDDFLLRHGALGCVGPDDAQWIHFHSAEPARLDPDSVNGTLWRRWFGLAI